MENKFKKDERYFASERQDMLACVPKEARKILDVGCGEGNFAFLVKNRLNAEVWGIEIQEEPGRIAQNRIDRVIIGDFIEVIEELPKKYFDCIVFNDVLEHMINPYEVLERAKEYLNKAGVVISSIPNVRYYSVLFEVLFKKDWEYKNSGILDNTHLRFFTKKSIRRMFEDLGYDIIKLEGICPTRSLKYSVINFILMNSFSDSKYLKYACVARIKIDI